MVSWHLSVAHCCVCIQTHEVSSLMVASRCDSGASAGTGCYPLTVAKKVLPKVCTLQA
jgi:hypothetical protein